MKTPSTVSGAALAVALLIAAGAAPALAGGSPVQLAQAAPQEANKSPQRKAAEKKLEDQGASIDKRIEKERDDFLKSDKGKAARDKVEEKRKERDKEIKMTEEDMEAIRKDPDAKSCCVPGFKENQLRFGRRLIEEARKTFEAERRKIIDEEMKKADKERATKLDALKKQRERVGADLKKLRELPAVPPPDLSSLTPPANGELVLVALPGVSFAGAGGTAAESEILRALKDEARGPRVPALAIPRVPTMPATRPEVERAIPPMTKPPVEVMQ